MIIDGYRCVVSPAGADYFKVDIFDDDGLTLVYESLNGLMILGIDTEFRHS